MSTYLFVNFEVHCTVSRYVVCLEEYMDLSLRLISNTKLEHSEPMRRAKRSARNKTKEKSHILLNTLEYRIGYNLALTKDSHIFMY